MGYNSYLSGVVKATPAPTASIPTELLADPLAGGDSEFFIHILGEDDTVGVVDGKITVIEGERYAAIEPRSQEPYNAQGCEDDFAAAILWLAENGATTFEGAIYGTGENNEDMWRIRVYGFSPSGIPLQTHEYPELVWPDGTKGLGADIAPVTRDAPRVQA